MSSQGAVVKRCRCVDPVTGRGCRRFLKNDPPTRAQYRRTHNLRVAYENGIASLERLATVLAYGDAGLATGVVPAESWAKAPAMGRVLDVLEELPGTGVVVPRETLIDTAVQLAKRLRRLLQEQGFDCYLLDDGTLWFEVR